MTALYRIETTAIANVTLYVEADDEEAALTVVRAANDKGATAVRFLLASCGGVTEVESLALDTAFDQKGDEAAVIDNGGLPSQLEYLVARLGPAATRKAIDRIDGAAV